MMAKNFAVFVGCVLVVGGVCIITAYIAAGAVAIMAGMGILALASTD